MTNNEIVYARTKPLGLDNKTENWNLRDSCPFLELKLLSSFDFSGGLATETKRKKY